MARRHKGFLAVRRRLAVVTGGCKSGLPLRQPARVTMTTLEDIEKAVAELPADQLARFRVWFEEFEAARFDQKIERDAKAGRLDQLAEQALADFRAGRAREL
jgi:hypothetical protein